jgi:hypothetical protein
MPAIRVEAHFDEQANVWVATSDDIAGLVVEADTLEQLRVEVLSAVPELIELNGLTPDLAGQSQIVVEIASDHKIKNPLVA